MAKFKLEGMVGIQLTPFDEKGNLDEKSYRRLVKYMFDNGNSAICTMGSISESRTMLDEQRKRVCEITAEEVKGKIPVIQGIVAEGIPRSVKLAKDAAEAGASALLLPYLGLSSAEDSMYNHFYAVANAVPDLDIMLYDASYLSTPSAIPVTVMKKLAKNVSNFRYVKSQVSVTKVTETKNALGDDYGLFCGTDTFLVPWLQLGCIGGTNSTPNVIPMHIRKVYEAGLKKDWDAVNANWFKCYPVIYAFYGMPGVRVYKHALYWLGLFDNPRYLDATQKPKEEHLAIARKALIDLGMKLVR